MTTPLQIAAQHLIDRWDSPLWKDQPHTGVYIAELRKALEAEQVQTVDPVATVQCINGVTIGYLDAMQPVGTKLYTHPAPPAQQVAVPMTSQELEKCWTRVKGTSFGYAPFARAIEAFHGIGAKP